MNDKIALVLNHAEIDFIIEQLEADFYVELENGNQVAMQNIREIVNTLKEQMDTCKKW